MQFEENTKKVEELIRQREENIAKAKEMFWAELQQLVDAKYALQDVSNAGFSAIGELCP